MVDGSVVLMIRDILGRSRTKLMLDEMYYCD